jgi:hypothetical protein
MRPQRPVVEQFAELAAESISGDALKRAISDARLALPTKHTSKNRSVPVWQMIGGRLGKCLWFRFQPGLQLLRCSVP